MKLKRPAFYFPFRERESSWFSRLLKSLFLLFLLAVTWLLVVLAMGVPGSWIRKIERRLPDSPFAAELSAVSFDLFRGLLLRDVRIYRKGVVGLPLLSADTVRLEVNPLASVTGGNWLREVWVSGGVLRDWEGGGQTNGIGLPDFGQWQFRLELENSRLRDQRVDRAGAQVAVSGGQIRLTRAEAVLGEKEGPSASVQGAMTLDAATRRYQANFTWNGEPLAIETLLLSLGSTNAVSVIREFTSGLRPPSGDAEFEGTFGADRMFGLKASAAGRDCVFRGVALRQVFLNMQFHSGGGQVAVLSFDPIVLIREDGLSAGGLSFDFASGDIRFDGYSTCPPAVLARLAAPGMAGFLDGIRMEGPVRLHAGGTLNTRDFTRNTAAVYFDGEKIGARRFLADRCSFNLRLAGTTCEIRDLAGACYGGTFTGAVDLAVTWAPDRKLGQVQFAVQGGCQDVDWRAFAVSAGLKGAERYEGRVSAGGRLSGMAGEGLESNLSGAGKIRIREGRLFRFPLFGPLSDFLTRLFPGQDVATSRTDVSADFQVENGLIRTDNAVASGDLVSLYGRGAYALTNSLDFDIEIKLMKGDTLIGKAVRALTLPVSKLFQFRLRGSVEAPHWYPVNFSSDLLEKLPFTGREPRGAEPGARKRPAEAEGRPEP